MQNDCVFSADRRYRYVLKHTWEPLFPPKLCTWIGLNPSILDETQLDPTLRRIRAFSAAWGYNGFLMTNLFGLVSTDPARVVCRRGSDRAGERSLHPPGSSRDRQSHSRLG